MLSWEKRLLMKFSFGGLLTTSVVMFGECVSNLSTYKLP